MMKSSPIKLYFIFTALIVWMACGTGQSQIEITVYNVSCHGGSNGDIRISTGIYCIYEWLDGYVSPEGPDTRRHDLKAGVYTVAIYLKNGDGGKTEECFAVRSIEVTEPPPLNVHIKTIPEPGPHRCWRLVPVTLEITASGGIPPYKINGVETDIHHMRISSTSVANIYVTDRPKCTVEKEKHVLIGAKWCSSDPNDIIGPSGFEEPNWVSRFDTLPYTIRFENDPILANAPAQHVFITHDFDEEINPFSFRLRDFGFGDLQFSVPANVSSFQQRYDLTEALDMYLDVIAGFNVHTNQAFWSFTAIDPATGLRPVNPLIGFLPVNDTLTGSGEGFVSFTARPKSTVMTGDTAHAQASIVFDVNDPILTNIWTNVLDALPPTTSISAIEPISPDTLITLTWAGADDPGGSGLREYQLYVSVDSGDLALLRIMHPDSNQLVFEGEYDHHYQFYVVGVDNTGNTEIKTVADASVYILAGTEVRFTSLDDIDYCAKDTLVIAWTSFMVDTVTLSMRIDQGDPIAIASPISSTSSPLVWQIPDSLSGKHIQLYIAHTSDAQISDSSGLFFIQPLPDVTAPPDRSVCPGSVQHLSSSGATIYDWQPASAYYIPGEPIMAFFADTTTLFRVTGTNDAGCANSDSIWVIVQPTYLDTIVYLMCYQDSVYVEGAYQTEPGFYTDALASVWGCDSTVVTQVILTGPCTFPSAWVFVDQDATGQNNGTSWEDAFVDLQDALNVSREWLGVEEIWIAEGDYKPHESNRDSSFIFSDSIRIYGGFLGIEETREERTADPDLVHLSGDINVADAHSDNSYHTVQLLASCDSCVIDGVTIIYGYADQPAGQHDIGAGVLNTGKGLFVNVVFEHNYATGYGAAVHSSGDGALLIFEDCTFRLNTSMMGTDLLNHAGAQMIFKGANSLH